jgi:hypothetical protein
MIYEMNFDHMRELHWEFGLTMAVAAMGLTGSGVGGSSTGVSGCDPHWGTQTGNNMALLSSRPYKKGEVMRSLRLESACCPTKNFTIIPASWSPTGW